MGLGEIAAAAHWAIGHQEYDDAVLEIERRLDGLRPSRGTAQAVDGDLADVGDVDDLAELVVCGRASVMQKLSIPVKPAPILMRSEDAKCEAEVMHAIFRH